VLIPIRNFRLIIDKSFLGKKDYSLVSEDPVYMEFRLDRSQGEEFEQFLLEHNMRDLIHDKINR